MSDSIAIVQAFAELRYGAVVHTRENSVKYGHNLGQTPYVDVYILKRFSLLPLKEVKRIEHLQLEIIYMLHEKMTYTLHTRCEVTS